MRQGQRAVSGNPVLLLRTHLAEGAVVAVRPKDRIVAKSGRPARRKDKGPIHPALESFDCAVGPCERQHADKSRPPRRRGRALFEFASRRGPWRRQSLSSGQPISPNKCPARRRAPRRRARNRRRARPAPRRARRLEPSKGRCRERSIRSPQAPRDQASQRRAARCRRVRAALRSRAACRRYGWRRRGGPVSRPRWLRLSISPLNGRRSYSAVRERRRRSAPGH